MSDRRITCRSCEQDRLVTVLDLGVTPIADSLLDSTNPDEPEPLFPLEVAVCEACGLVQILETLPPEVLFSADYPYYSSFADIVVENAAENSADVLARWQLGPDSLVVEVASNDGYLLKGFVAAGVPVLGIDPAPGPARAAVERGVPTLCAFFSTALARRLVAEGRQADAIFGNNVLAHVADTNGFVAGLAMLLKPGGVIVIEVPYVVDLVDRCEFDTIYHQHLCYFAVGSAQHLFARHGLALVDVRRLPLHGGSLRLYFAHGGTPSRAVTDLLAEERRRGVGTVAFYADFAARVAQIKAGLVALLTRLKGEGATIAGYGAAAKAVTLLNYCGVGPGLIDYVVDRNTHKQGKVMPGQRLEIFDPARLLETRPDYLLLLAWNHAPEIMRQQGAYLDGGGRCIVPIPKPEVVRARAGAPA